MGSLCSPPCNAKFNTTASVSTRGQAGDTDPAGRRGPGLVVEKVGLEEPLHVGHLQHHSEQEQRAQCNRFLALNQKQGVNTQKFVVMGSSVAVVRHLTVSSVQGSLSAGDQVGI